MAGCKGKRRHRTEQAAIAAAIRLSHFNRPLRVYHCPVCSGFHLTKRPTWTDTPKETTR